MVWWPLDGAEYDWVFHCSLGGHIVKRFVISVSIVLLVLSLGFNVDVAWSQAKKDLNQAAVDGDLERVKTLVGQGSDVNAKNRMGMTPLVVAAMNNRTAVCEFLVTKGADLNAKDGKGQTALYFAVDRNNKELVEMLVKKGADVNVGTGRGENAFSLAKKKGNTEIADLLAKSGATDPVVLDAYGEDFYDQGATPPGGRPGATGARSGRSVAQATVEVDLLADPNEIKSRVKTFEGLEKTIKDVGAKSANEKRYWENTRSDNRTLLSKYVQKQLDDEFALVRKVANEEKAAKTTEAIDTMLKKKKARDTKVRAALMQQRREATAGQSSRGGSRSRGSSRTSGRSSGRGSTSGYGTGTSSSGYAAGGSSGGGSYGGYDDAGGMGTTGRGRTGRSSARPAEQLDPDTEEEIRLWEQATPDKKLDLAKSLHPLTYGDFAYIRGIAVGEEAKKTTAAIDGLLLARQERYNAYVKKAEAERSTLAPGQAPGAPGQYGDPSTQRGVRTRGGRSRGTVGGTQQQNTQTGRRGRR